MTKSRNIAQLQLAPEYGMSTYKIIPMAFKHKKTGVSTALMKNGEIATGKIDVTEASEIEKINISGRSSRNFNLDDDVDVKRVAYIKTHPSVRVVGDEDANPNFDPSAHYLDLIIPKEIATVSIKNDKVISTMKSIIHNLDDNSKYNIAYPMGLVVQEMSAEEIYESLLNIASAYKDGEKATPAAILYDLLADREGIEYKVIIAKARHEHFKLIKNEDGVWKFNGSVLGANDAQIKNHFNNHKEQYIALRRSVASMDDLTIDEQEWLVEKDMEKWGETETTAWEDKMTKVEVPAEFNLPKKTEKVENTDLDSEGKIKAPKRGRGARISSDPKE